MLRKGRNPSIEGAWFRQIMARMVSKRDGNVSRYGSIYGRLERSDLKKLTAKARRFTSPDETPFTADLPPPIIPPLSYPKILHPNDVNVNKSILSYYVHTCIPRITHNATLAIATANRARGIKGESEFDDDGNYGSAATVDVELLQAMSKRVHYGKFVSESKFRSKPSDFIPHIVKPNRVALEALIVKPEVERALLARVRKKATLYSQELDLQGEPLIIDGDVGRDGKIGEVRKGRFRVDVDAVEQLYENFLIPLTKEVEVDYLLQRLDGLSKEDIEALRTV
ncbi:chorismate mutase aro7 [Serendipita sp. 396]|nr:chorismate mutase aro7 [Serendipita sp. 396]KAG8789259.1 chorismate mutase aro7 [Serendipita sp. 397]KAG8804477.1 chorismate mutase aro7 [Serendipita sp. 398]KAG8827558.1 chorismate mutase aro7 [Serendipita sp. 401]KAG8878437.1 chorismate mutase aro7 [Serendipita sp. 405]KAG9057961.1 chorismate mutase aro7 [Serendipita sp. 407]